MILIAIGSNLPFDGASPLALCEAAVAAMEADGPGGLRLGPAARSAWYASPPFPPDAGGGDYVNGAAGFRPPPGTDADPAALLRLLHRIEDRFGRRRSVANAPRTLDLDIVAIGALVRTATDPVVPHPRAHRRRFVLEPLRDVAPGWIHPVTGLGIEAMLALLPDQPCTRLASPRAQRAP